MATLPPTPLAGPGRSVQQAVTRRYRELTRAEQQVADAVLHQPRRVIDLPIYELARELGVAPAVISRFSRAVGFVGLRALRLAMAEEVGAAAAELPPTDDRPAEPLGGPLWDVAQRAMLDDVRAIQHTLASLDPAALQAAAVLLARSRRVLTAGNDASGTVAWRLAAMLARRGWRARAEVGPNDTTWTNDIDAQDAVVVISHRGQLLGPGTAVLAALPIIRTRGARILALTNVPESPVGRAADLVLATYLPGATSDDAYFFDPVFPVQIVTARALVAAAVAAREGVGPEGGSA